MKYMGSKNRIAKELIPIILKDRKENQWYIEPMVGGCNIIDKINGKRCGADINPYLIALWKAVSKGWMPPKQFTEEQYKDVRINKNNYPPELVGYIGFALSYGGKWFGGWCRDSQGKRNYVTEAYKNAEKQFPKLKDILFINKSYDQLYIPKNSIVYCDPPYEGTTKYKNNFNHSKFWEWCRLKTNEGHKVFISEYNAPKDFKCVYEKEQVSSLTQNTGEKKAIERLFTLY